MFESLADQIRHDEREQRFEARAGVHGWMCPRCGKEIKFEDRDTFREAGRCARCHQEVDIDSGTVGKL